MSEVIKIERARLPPEAALMGITMLWGGTFLIIKLALVEGGAVGLVGFRFALGALLLAVIGRPGWPTRREWIGGLFIGSALFAGYGLQALGLTTIASSRSAFFTALYIPLVPLLQFTFFKKPPGWSGFAGAVLAFAGVVMLSHPSGETLHFSVGDLLTIACAVGCALEIILLSHFAPDCNPQRLAMVEMAVVALLSLIFISATGQGIPWHYWPFWMWTGILGVATSLIMFAQAWGQAKVPALRATLIYAMEPVWAGIVGAVAGEAMGWQTLTGAGLIFAAVLVDAVKKLVPVRDQPLI
jgi:drug/metabolite transporter (DMT)-like permease